MKKGRSIAALAILLVAVFVCMLFANGIQSSWGEVEVETIKIDYVNPAGENEYLTAKLYKPITASAENPAPAVLMLHGYQNDKETNDAYSIELSRRGVVVLSVDEYGHGSSSEGMFARGWTDHKVTVNYGNDSEEDGTYAYISGPMRYHILMNFSNLSFFNDRYSKGSDGSEVYDSSMGGVSAYAWLGSCDFVDDTNMAVSGHSMGTWASWSVAGAYSGATNAAGEDVSPKAVVLQCGELFTKSSYDSEKINFNNVLLLQAKYDEFNYFRDYEDIVSDKLMSTPLRLEFLGCTDAAAKWDTTYGNFDDGSARRIELIWTNHRLTTHDTHALSAAMDWFEQSLGTDFALESNDFNYNAKELLILAAFMMSIFAMLPLMNLILCIPYFKKVAQRVPDRPEKAKTNGAWWRGAVITMLIAAATYPFMTQLGQGLLPLPEGIFRMTIGNGFLSWYALCIIIMIITTIIPWNKSKKTENRLDWYDIGMATEDKPGKLGWGLMGRSALVALIMLGMVYGIVVLCESVFQLDLRFIWPFLKGFTAERFVQFLIYIPIFFLFFLMNNSKIFAQMRTKSANQPGLRAYLSDWWRNAMCMVGGILIVILIEYIPFFLEMGPGADLLFGTTFGGPFMSLLIVFAPQVIVFSLLCTYIYRKTGNVFVSSMTVSAIACWIVTGGSAIL